MPRQAGACLSSQTLGVMNDTEPVRTTVEALRRVKAFDGAPEEFVLPVHESLLDPFGMNMAVITDAVLARGWEPDGFDQQQGFRLYKYKEIA